MTLKPIVVQVVIDKPLAQGFDYLWDAEKLGRLPEIGSVVEVPFARGKEVGLVIKVSNHSDYEIEKLKSVRGGDNLRLKMGGFGKCEVSGWEKN